RQDRHQGERRPDPGERPLHTTIRAVDLTLGTAKATIWQAVRDADGNQLVVPDTFSTYANDPNARQGQYFYRYDLADGGKYLFNGDGTPSLQTVTNAA